MSPDLAPLLDDVERRAPALDRGDDDVRATLRRLAGYGLLDLAAGPDRVAELPRVVDLVEGLAARCLPTAFSLWAHRMVIDYLAHADPPAGLDPGALVRGERWGSTGLAPALRDVVGLGAVPLTARRDGAGVRVDGPVRWASNLFPGTLLVVPVRLPDEGDDARAVVALSIDAPGVTVHAHPRLLAMNATASSALTLADAPAAVLTEDLGAFVAAVRPRLLLVQSAFCLGLAGRSVREAGAGLRGDAAVLGGDVTEVGDRVDEARAHLARGADRPGAVAVPDLLRLRLDAARLAGDATRLEAAVAGGAGYVADSGTARRGREAAFLPVQAPTEALLRVCLRPM